ncbi:hypothetical protein BC629DRAFT_1589506 [Irpex lacteus]|nr:hypothetical protein BC629DRAFT_1589506 [Irpex lacteus]
MAPSFTRVLSALTVVFSALSVASAETHTITFDNKCGRGTPTLLVGGKVVSTGQPFTSSGTISGIAYLQTGECLYNGENCSILEFTLTNPAPGCIGCGSSADISLIAPHKFNVVSGYSFYNGCDGQGHICTTATCKDAFFKPDDNQVQTGCQTDNVNLRLSFCEDSESSGSADISSAESASSSHAAAKTTSEPAKATAATPTAPVNVAAPPAISVASSSHPSATSAAASPSSSVRRTSCKAKQSSISARATLDVQARGPSTLHNRRIARRRAESFKGIL